MADSKGSRKLTKSTEAALFFTARLNNMPIPLSHIAGFNDSALILRLSPRGESDLMVDLYTREHGRLRVLAKGAKRSKKRFVGLLLTGQHIEAELAPFRKGGDLLSLSGASLVGGFGGLRQDWRYFLLASPVYELLLKCTAQNDPHPRIFDLALASLAALENAQSKTRAASALILFLTRLLEEAGFGLTLDCCLACGCEMESSGEAFLSLQGGTVCGRCPETASSYGRYQVPLGLVKSLEAASRLELSALDRLNLPPALLTPGLAFLGRFWQQVAGLPLPSLGLAARALRAMDAGRLG